MSSLTCPKPNSQPSLWNLHFRGQLSSSCSGPKPWNHFWLLFVTTHIPSPNSSAVRNTGKVQPLVTISTAPTTSQPLSPQPMVTAQRSPFFALVLHTETIIILEKHSSAQNPSMVSHLPQKTHTFLRGFREPAWSGPSLTFTHPCPVTPDPLPFLKNIVLWSEWPFPIDLPSSVSRPLLKCLAEVFLTTIK